MNNTSNEAARVARLFVYPEEMVIDKGKEGVGVRKKDGIYIGKTATTTQIQARRIKTQTSEARLNHTCVFLWSDSGSLKPTFRPPLPRNSIYQDTLQDIHLVVPTPLPMLTVQIYLTPSANMHHHLSIIMYHFCSEA